MKIVSNCPLCEEYSLHVIGEDGVQTQQCINCGYVSSEKLKLNGMSKEDSEEYKKLPDDMRKWSTVKNDRIWLPTMMVLPFGMLYPVPDKNGELQWAFSEMVNIPEEEQKNYPREDGKGFHTKRIDTDNSKMYDLFLEGLSELNQKMKKELSEPKKTEITEIKLPKLKKMNK
jgi:Zn ribbon nucleic-acid-binding protein